MTSFFPTGISAEKVEINPLPPKGAAKLLTRPQKPTTYSMDSIAACEIISKKYSVYYFSICKFLRNMNIYQ